MKTILLIEDDTALRENTAELLELANYSVFMAPNGKIGIEVAKEQLPDIIVCDIMMPEVDGYGVLEAVSLEPTTAHIPFIFLSARTEHKEIRKGMDLGADDYLTKPFEEDELLSAIESRLAKAEILSKSLDIVSTTDEGLDDVRNLHELKNLFDDTGEITSFAKGEVIYQRGAHSNNVYLITKGVVKCTRTEDSGKELITNLYRTDSFLGFTSFDYNIRYEETATAVEEVTVTGISKNLLKSILSKNQNVSLELMNVLTHDITKIKEQLLQMAYSSVRRKTAQTILQFTKILNKKPNEAIKISRSDLASVAGIATESLIRTLSEFKKKGLIEIEGRNIKILNIKELETIE
jgi:DNA-binding response OmpR family regulator